MSGSRVVVEIGRAERALEAAGYRVRKSSGSSGGGVSIHRGTRTVAARVGPLRAMLLGLLDLVERMEIIERRPPRMAGPMAMTDGSTEADRGGWSGDCQRRAPAEAVLKGESRKLKAES